jgi:hypothetical protein
MSEDTLTLPETARALGISLDDALRLIELGKLSAGRGSDGALYVRRDDLDAYRATVTV